MHLGKIISILNDAHTSSVKYVKHDITKKNNTNKIKGGNSCSHVVLNNNNCESPGKLKTSIISSDNKNRFEFRVIGCQKKKKILFTGKSYLCSGDWSRVGEARLRKSWSRCACEIKKIWMGVVK